MNKINNLFLICTLVLIPFLAQATDDLMNADNSFEQLKISQNFLDNLKTCTPFEEKKEIEILGIKQSAVYKILGKIDGKCQIETISQTDKSLNINSTTKCQFDDENLELYLDSMQRLITKKMSPTEALANEDNLMVMGMMMQEDICQTTIGKIDLTEEFRKKLKNCEPTSQSVSANNSTITRKIVSKNGDICNILYSIATKAPDLKKLGLKDNEIKIPDIEFSFNCKLDAKQTAQYLQILEDAVIPEGNASDMNLMIKSKNNANNEMTFISTNCSAGDIKTSF